MSMHQISFEQALNDAQQDPEIMDAIEFALEDIEQRVNELHEDFGTVDAILRHGSLRLNKSIRYVQIPNELLEEYSPYLEHYQRLREHF